MWELAFYADKCHVIHNPNKKMTFCSDYSIHNQKLTIRIETKYIAKSPNDLFGNRHGIDNFTKKANSTMGFLKRNISSKRHPSDQQWTMFTVSDNLTCKKEMVLRSASR